MRRAREKSSAEDGGKKRKDKRKQIKYRVVSNTRNVMGARLSVVDYSLCRHFHQ